MKVQAKSEEITYIVTLSTAFLYLAIANLVFSILAIIILIFIHTHLLFLLLSAVSGALSVLFYLRYKKFIKRQIKIDDCYIEMGDDYFDCSQISDEGEYEFFHINVEDISKITTLDGKDLYGFALWIKGDSEKSYILVDDKKSSRTIAPVTFLGYEKDVFEKIFNDLFNKLDGDIEIDTKTKWKKPSLNGQILKASFLEVALFIPYVIALIIK